MAEKMRHKTGMFFKQTEKRVQGLTGSINTERQPGLLARYKETGNALEKHCCPRGFKELGSETIPTSLSDQPPFLLFK